MLALLLAATVATTPEVERIQRHFDGALDLLARRDVSALSGEQRSRRESLIAELRRYRDRGLFPRNYDFPGEAVPYFVDRKTAVRCAVAHLLEYTGRADIVARVAAFDNNIWVAQLSADAPFNAWLDENGLTLAEAARIQVPYIEEPPPLLVATGMHRTTAQGVTLTAALATTLLSRVAPTDRNQRAIGLLGLTASTLSLASGLAATQDRGVGPLAVANALVGGVGMYVGGRTFHRGVVAHRIAQRARVTPIIPVSSSTGTGISVSISF